MLPLRHQGKAIARTSRRGQPRDYRMLVQSARGLATLTPKAPQYFREMHPEAPHLDSHQRHEHLRPEPGAMLLASKRERAEILPVDRSQSVEFRIVHGLSFLLP